MSSRSSRKSTRRSLRHSQPAPSRRDRSPARMPNDPVMDAKNDLRASITRLKDGEAEVTKRRQAVPPPTFKDDGLLLKEAATIRSELTAQELLLNHMEAIAVKVDPPTTESGKALAEAIMALNE